MLEQGERIFGKEHATKRARSVSHLNQKTIFDVSQLYNRVKLLPTDYRAPAFPGLDTSILQVENGCLTPKDIYIPAKGNESTTVRQIESINEEGFGITWEPGSDTAMPNIFEFNDTFTRVCVQNKPTAPLSVNINFSDINSTPEWNGEPMNFIYVHCCADPTPDEYKSLNISGNSWGGGIFFHMYSDNPAPSQPDWTPLLVSSQISSRVIAIPLTYTQKKIKLMIKGCRSWSLEFLTYITGI